MKIFAKQTLAIFIFALLFGCGGNEDGVASAEDLNAVKTEALSTKLNQLTPVLTGQVVTLISSPIENPSPTGIASDYLGNIFVAMWRDDNPDRNDHIQSSYYDTIRKINSNNQEFTFASYLSAPVGLAVDKLNNIYAIATDDSSVKKFTANGTPSTFIDLIDISATPNAIAFDAKSNLIYVADYFSKIYVISCVGNESSGSLIATIKLPEGSRPQGIAFDNNGIIFATDYNLNKIWKISKSGFNFIVITLPIIADDNSSLNNPYGIAIDKENFIFVADQGNHVIRKINANGSMSTIAGVVGVPGSNDGVAMNAKFNQPTGLTFDEGGFLYVSEFEGAKIRKIKTSNEGISFN